MSKLVAVRMARRGQEPAVAADLVGTVNASAAQATGHGGGSEVAASERPPHARTVPAP